MTDQYGWLIITLALILDLFSSATGNNLFDM
jgi:hypothetical protein